LGNVAAVPTWRRLAIVGLLGFVALVGAWAFRPWTSSVSLPAVANKVPQATFECGAVFGRDSVHPSNDLARSDAVLAYRPCSTRSARRVLAMADAALGAAGVVALVGLRTPQPAGDT